MEKQKVFETEYKYIKNKKYYIPGTLNNLIKKLDNRFIKSSRSYIINTEQISSYDIKSNILTFKGKIRLNCISRDNKRMIINHLRRV